MSKDVNSWLIKKDYNQLNWSWMVDARLNIDAVSSCQIKASPTTYQLPAKDLSDSNKIDLALTYVT
jgi:hypothetical protein